MPAEATGMKIMPPQPAGGAARPAGLSTFISIALIALLIVATGTFARNRVGAAQTSGTATGSTTFSLANPPATTAGSVLLAVVDANVASVGSIAAPAGWTLVRSDSAQSATGQLTQALYLRVASGAEPSSYTWSFSAAANAGGGIVAYSGVDPVTPVDSATGLAVNVATKTLTTPSVTTSGAGEFVVAAFGASDRSPSTPSGMNQRWRVGTQAVQSTVADVVQAGAGPTPTASASIRQSGTSLGVAQLVALRHAPTGTPPPSPPPAPSSQPPAIVTSPNVSGTTTQGQTLTASTGTWNGSPTGYAYQWRDCQAGGSPCANISGATSPTYTLVGADVSSSMRVVVTATNAAGSATALSAPTAIVGSGASAPTPTPAPANTGLPVVSGSATQGQTLTVSTGTWAGSPTAYGYQWQRCGATCADIAGATSASYLLSSSDVGNALQAVVTATNGGGSASATSGRSATVVAPQAPAPAPQPPAPGPACTIYVAPNGSSSNTGTSPSSPLTIAAANAQSGPGSVICLAAGTYKTGLVQAHSGTASAWIVWRSYNGEPVINWDTSQSKNYMFKVSDGAGYVEFDDLTFDGASTATAAVGCQNHGHHIRVLDSTVRFMGDAGISINNCDYATIVGNTVYRFGDYYGWSSGINLNWNAGAYWYDQGPGFHNVIADNFVSGGVDNSSYHSDGNGIILDLGGNISPTLITGNVVYMNGGRGIETLQTTGKVYVVNNTLYKNGLDLRMGAIGEAVANASSNQVWANNAVLAWAPRYTYQLLGGSTGVTYSRDSTYGGLGTQNLASTVLGDPLQMLATNPLFVAPPSVDPSADGQWRNPPTVAALGNGLALQGGSPLVDAGVDPRKLPGLDASLLAGINQYAMTAIDGTSRPAGSGFDYGAYER